MRNLVQPFLLGILAFFLAVMVVASGCTFNASKHPQYHDLPINMTILDVKKAPCGILHIQNPLFNVTGSLTAEVKPNSTIYLFVAPDTSFKATLYSVGNCPSLSKGPVGSDLHFNFNYLSAGDYVAMVPRNAFLGNTQGFPIVHEVNGSDYSVWINFYGGNRKYSVVSFSIRLHKDQKPKNSYS